MLLGLLMAAGTPASTGCFNGGAFVGAQGGFTRITLKQEAKAKAITKEEAGKAFDVVVRDLGSAASYTAYDTAADATAIAALKDFDAGVATVKVTIPAGANATATQKAITDTLSAYATSGFSKNAKDLKGIKVAFVGDAAFKTAFGATGAAAIATVVATETAKIKKDDVVKELTDADAEVKYTSNNGFAGLHAGYLGRVNDKFLVGGLIEGNWVFGQDMKVNDVEVKDTKARFNFGAYLRAMFNLTEKFMAGADLGFSGQEIRQLKEVGKTDKESKWFWNPAARLVLGVTLTDNILATAHFGGVFPMMKQDSLRDSAVKAKYSNFHGGVGISYVFGG